jgi:iron complex transport system ATP-binding protein
MTAVSWERIGLAGDGRTIRAAVTLAGRAGAGLGLVGPNGAGKSALLRCAAGLVPGFVGAIEIGGTALGALAPVQRARRLAYLPQSGETAWPITVAAAVALGRLAHGERSDAPAAVAAVAAALAAVGIDGLGPRRLDTLSGGERALALLARALAVEAPLLLLDEPCAALDPRGQLAAMALFRRLAAGGACVCVVLHDLSLAARFCDRVAVLDRGRLVAQGPPAEVLDDTVLGTVYGVRGLRCVADGADILIPWAPLAGAGVVT